MLHEMANPSPSVLHPSDQGPPECPSTTTRPSLLNSIYLLVVGAPPHSRESKPLPPAAHTHTGAHAPGAAAHISQVPLGYHNLVYATTGLLFSLCKPQYSKNELHKIPIIPVLIHIFRCFCSAIPPSTDALCIEHLDMNKT